MSRLTETRPETLNIDDVVVDDPYSRVRSRRASTPSGRTTPALHGRTTPALRGPREPRAGQLLDGKYLIKGPLGDGGMGRVYEALHVGLGRPVAVKVIRSELMTSPQLVARFVTEARAAASLMGDNIAQVLDAGVSPEGLPYFVMELLHGETIAEVLDRSGVFSVEQTIDYSRQICAGLEEAHEKGIVHRDIKSQNLIITARPAGRLLLKILDFGIAKLLFRNDGKQLTSQGESMGSPSYMSPEQMRMPCDVDFRTDIWSLGVVMYEMLTGELPFDGATVHVVCANVLSEEPQRLSELRGGVPAELEAAVHRCLVKDPRARTQSTQQLSRELRDIERQLGAPPRESTAGWALGPASDAPPSTPHRRTRRPVVLALVAAAVLGSMGAIFAVSGSFSEARRDVSLASASVYRNGDAAAGWLLAYVAPMLEAAPRLEYTQPTAESRTYDAPVLLPLLSSHLYSDMSRAPSTAGATRARPGGEREGLTVGQRRSRYRRWQRSRLARIDEVAESRKPTAADDAGHQDPVEVSSEYRPRGP